ncbi:glutathione S-transferase family protein [Agrobacterium leguminum]|uniref:glutathione S-transferase family protein n=1 Tax=Agrobacterium leguminum TaxID=2792015 RepID=UPI003CE44F74
MEAAKEMNSKSNPITLYMSPGSCSRVTVNALEEARLVYELRVIDLRANEQHSADYLAVNPKGKVPALSFAGHVLTENPIILCWIDRYCPQAQILPDEEGLGIPRGLIDLVWCASSLHPMVRQIHLPSRFTDGETDGIRRDGMNKFAFEMQRISNRLAHQPWWYGDRWSIVDVYLHWLYSMAAGAGFSLSAYPAIADHGERVMNRESFTRSLERENNASQRRL